MQIGDEVRSECHCALAGGFTPTPRTGGEMRGAARSGGGEDNGICCTNWENLVDAKALDGVACACRRRKRAPESPPAHAGGLSACRPPLVVPSATASQCVLRQVCWGEPATKDGTRRGAWRTLTVGGCIVPPLHPSRHS